MRALTYSAVFITITSFIGYHVYDNDPSSLTPPIINDVFKRYREKNNITIYEMNELFITFTNMNENQEDQIIFYTLNGSCPKKFGIPYDDHHESETGIVVPISKVYDIDHPVIIKAVIGELGSFDRIIWSSIATDSFWNPDHLNHSNFGAGFNKIPIKLREKKRIIVRIWPKRMSDLVKCVYSVNKNSKVIKNKKLFWSDRFSSKTINVSDTDLFVEDELPYFNIHFDLGDSHHIYQDYIVVCSTSSKSIKETVKYPDYSSMLIKAKIPQLISN